MVTLKESALQMLNEQLSALHQIERAMVQSQNWDLARQKLERWRERTIKLIADRVSEEEAARFGDYDIPHYRRVLPLDDLTWLQSAISKMDSLLVALAEELLQPYGESLIKVEAKVLQPAPIERINQAVPDPRKVFLVYGRNRKVYEAMVLFLQAIGLEAVDFYELKARVGGSPFVGNIVRRGMDEAQAVIVLYTPDEYTSLHPSLCEQHDPGHEKNRWQPRPNVILEAGMALAISEDRTILVVFGNVSLPSDLHGRHYVRLNNSSNSREQLRALLAGQVIGCNVDFNRTTLHNTGLAGDFEACFNAPVLPEVSTHSPFR